METTTRMLLQTLLVSLNSSLSAPFNTTLDVSSSSGDSNSSDSSSSSISSNNNSSNNDSFNEGFLLGRGGGVEPPGYPTYQPIYIAVVNSVVFFTGTLGNVLVIVVVFFVRDMRSRMNWFLVNLSLADLLVLLVCQPAALTEFFARDRWFLGEALCKLVPFLEHTVLHASTLIILAITVERYYAICQPLKKLAVCRRPRPRHVLPALWIVASLTSVPFVFMTHLEQTLFFDGTPCEVCATSVREHWHFAYVLGTFVLFFAVPMLVLLGLYSRIIRCLNSSDSALTVRKDSNTQHTLRTRKNIIKMLVGIVVLFFVSLMPVRCMIIWQIFTSDLYIQAMGPEKYYNVMWITRLLMYANSAGNPIIYSLVSSKFQEAFWKLLTGRRNQGRSRTPRVSMFSRHGSSTSRLSLTELHRTWLSPKLPSPGIRQFSLSSLPAKNLQPGSALTHADVHVRAQEIRIPSARKLRRHQTTSFSAWTFMQNTPSASSPIVVRGRRDDSGSLRPLVKRRSSVDML